MLLDQVLELKIVMDSFSLIVRNILQSLRWLNTVTNIKVASKLLIHAPDDCISIL
jgi:hypothetical protein